MSAIQVLGISNAIVDVLTHVDDQFLTRVGVPRRSMVLIDEQRAEELYRQMGPTTEMSGGSVANTIAGIANLGGRTAYIGRVFDDQLGRIFVHDMQSLGVDVRLAAREEWTADRAQLHSDYAGRRAHDADLSRELHHARARAHHPSDLRPAGNRAAGGLCMGSAAGTGRARQGHRTRTTRRDGHRASRSRMRNASSGIVRSSLRLSDVK